MDLREAASVLGVHYQTAYAWARDGTLPARKVGRSYQIGEDAVRALAAARSLGREASRPIRVRDWTAQARRLYSAVAVGEEAAARRQIQRLTGGVPVIDLCERVIAPALRRVGDDWESGALSIAQEHRASAICERLIAPQARQPDGRPRGTAVVTTPPGERHGLPALMAAACLREDHWLVHHLASDLPVEDVARLADQVSADLVVFSSATSQAARRARRAARDVATGRPHLTALAGQPGDSLYDLRERARRSLTVTTRHRTPEERR